jgi:hypothetical protein
MFLKKELLQNLRAEVKVLTKCEYCGKDIGILDVRFTWLDKKNDRAMHDNCYEEYKKNSEKQKQINEKTPIQKDNNFKPEITDDELAKQIADTILNKTDRISILFNIFNNLPTELINWFLGMAKNRALSNSHIEIDLANYVDLGANSFPGDLVIRKNRDPKIEDVVELCSRDGNGYFEATAKVKKINIKDGTVVVYDSLNPDHKGEVSLSSIITVVDKVIQYQTDEWERMINTLNIEYEEDEIIKWLSNQITFINKTENFANKENVLKKLEERIKLTTEHNKK